MPKRSLNGGKNDRARLEQKKLEQKLEPKNAEQLNRALDAPRKRADGKIAKLSTTLASLLQIAADLRDLPRPEFKATLKRELGKGKSQKEKTSMSTLVQTPARLHPSAMPHLTFKDTAKAIDFYAAALGAVETFRFEAGGQIAHAEIKIGDTVFGLSDEWEAGGRLSAETWGHSPVSFRIFVDDVDSAAARAVAAGMQVTMPIKDEFYGYRVGNFADPFGYTWNLVTVKEELSVEQMYQRMENLGAPRKKPAVDPVPAGFSTVTPYMVASDGDAILAFAKNAFGAEETFRAVGGAGGIHGEMRIGDTTLMMGGGIPGQSFSGRPNTTALHIYVQDTDAAYKKALDAGATSISQPKDQDYGERGAGVKDPFGNYWYIATHTGESYIPKGLHNVNVYMHPWRAEPVITFLQRAFGARELARHATPDGIIHHAEIQVGDSVVEMGEAHGPYQPMRSMFYVYVPDCDAVYRRALAAGAKSIQQPADQPYGDRNGRVLDPFGNHWCIATRVKDV